MKYKISNIRYDQFSNLKKNRQVDHYLKIATIETGDYFENVIF